MAHLDGNAGKYPKSRAEKILFRVFLAAMTAELIIGILIGLIWCNGRSWWILPAILGVVALLYPLNRLMNRYMSKLGKERIKYWAGGQTEAYVAWMLKSELSDAWWVFNGIQLQPDWDIDHIVVGPGGVFAISTKNCRGCFSLEPEVCLNGQPTPMVAQVMSQAMELRKRLEALMGAAVPFVQPVLAAPFAFVAYAEKTQRVWVLHQDNLTDALSAEELRKRLAKEDVTRIVTALEMLKANALTVWKREPKSAV